MKTTQKDKRRLIQVARLLIEQLRQTDSGSFIRLRIPKKATRPQTDGWRVVCGDFGRGRPRIELWLDCFTKFAQPKFYTCLFSRKRKQIIDITRKVSKNLIPLKTITLKDIDDDGHFALTKRLRQDLLAKPILEKYEGETFFGIYDPTVRKSETATKRFCVLAANFFVSIAETLPKARGKNFQREDYPRFENRRLVKAHLRRERSAYLAAKCKERDNYQCRVCKKTFARMYTEKLGDGCLEAHHILPLGRLGNQVRTELKHLLTVCANCHRVLHRMNEPGDVVRLQKIVFKSR